jgi:hypothetical protein
MRSLNSRLVINGLDFIRLTPHIDERLTLSSADQ